MRFEHQIAKHERMEHHYRKYINTLRKKTGARTTSRPGLSSDAAEDVSPRKHYSVAKKDRDHIDLYTLGTSSYLLIRYMSSKLQANGKKTSPVITLQMLGFFRIF